MFKVTMLLGRVRPRLRHLGVGAQGIYTNLKAIQYVIGSYTSMRKTTRLKSGWGFGQTNSPLSTARVLIDAMFAQSR